MEHRRPSVGREDDASWRNLKMWVNIFSVALLAGVGYGIFVAHILPVLGKPWHIFAHDASRPYIVVIVHFFEVPLLLYSAFVGYYGLCRLRRTTERLYAMLVNVLIIVSMVFWLFETNVLIQLSQRQAPWYEPWMLLSVFFLLLTAAGFGFFLQWKITWRLSPKSDPRFAHPATEASLVMLVKKARREGLQIRVKGSEHSVAEAIFTDATEPEYLNIALDRYTKILHWDDENKQVTVQAGCHLGIDPNDALSTRDNSLLAQLDKRGWALPDLGGITHQTVAGFLSTGSAGGSTTFGVEESVLRLRLIDGTGTIHTLAPNPDDPDDASHNPFYAAGVSMGLLGIISTVTLQCVERYDIIGDNVTTRTQDCAIDIFGEGETSLQQHLQHTPYSRLLWWPQSGIHKMQVWQARRTIPADAATTHKNGRFAPSPLVQIPGGTFVQALLGLFFSFANASKPPLGSIRSAVITTVITLLQPVRAVKFWDAWWQALPMDNEISYDVLPVTFTELWIDIDKTAQVMQTLKQFYAGDKGLQRAGTFACELYAGKRSKFWLSPAYDMHVLRVDLMAILRGRSTPEVDYFPQFWELLQPYAFRYHWGKHMAPAESHLGVEYLKRMYPMWDKFMELRARLDPDQIFVSAYWRRYLGLTLP